MTIMNSETTRLPSCRRRVIQKTSVHIETFCPTHRQLAVQHRHASVSLFAHCTYTWRADYNTNRPHSRLGWMSPAIYAADRRSTALRSTDGFASRTAVITAQQGNADRQTPIATG
jgi:hypothetical protein